MRELPALIPLVLVFILCFLGLIVLTITCAASAAQVMSHGYQPKRIP
jgi:hypothetical protein